jgi:hypothetical protein
VLSRQVFMDGEMTEMAIAAITAIPFSLPLTGPAILPGEAQ